MRSRAVAMVMPMVLAATCACAALGLTENSGLSERELTSLRTQFLWADPARKVPAFIPQEVLETTPIDKLPLNIDNKEFLEAQVKSFATRNYACNPPGGLAMPQGSAKRTYSLDELVSLGYSAFVGQIVHLEPGWSIVTLNAAEAAYLRVEEVVFERQGVRTPQPGAIVGMMFHGGHTIVGETPVCQDRRDGFYCPVVGDRVLVVGNQLPDAGPLYYAASMVYPLSREGVVLSQPYMELDEDEHWVTLGDLRVKLAKRQRDLRSEP